MKFGVREICDVVLKAKAAQKIGSKVFYKNEPVIYFDSLKTSSLEGQSTTVYAQGGRGNARLIGWDGERTVTFTMEDALISPTGIAILTGAGLIDAKDQSVIIHTTEKTNKVVVNTSGSGASKTVTSVEVTLEEAPYLPGATVDTDTGVYTISSVATDVASMAANDYIYIMLLENDEPVTEPFIPSEMAVTKVSDPSGSGDYDYKVIIYATETPSGDPASGSNGSTTGRKNDLSVFSDEKECIVLVDYYREFTDGAFQVDITPDKFGGNFYLEASTLFRDTNGVDMPAEFVIPNCKVQSNFTFTMASSGDPSTFTFTMDAFPDYTRWNQTKKVLAAIQVINTSEKTFNFHRLGTKHDNGSGSGSVNAAYNADQKPYIEI